MPVSVVPVLVALTRMPSQSPAAGVAAADVRRPPSSVSVPLTSIAVSSWKRSVVPAGMVSVDPVGTVRTLSTS
jgi:hypothetical protein